jgi:DnaJ-class molecular chaperone
MTHYETLGIGESATPEEIKRAYRRLASQHHPDKGGDTAKFQEIQTAYDTLADADKRAQYDHERRNPGMPGGVHFQWHGGNPGMPGGMEDIFRQFGFPGGDPFEQFRHAQQPRRNKDLRVHIEVPLASTLAEQHKTLSVQTTGGTRETVDVTIPRGVTNGTQIKYPGLGDNLFETLARGDLFVQVSIAVPDNFYVNGLDLYTRISVNCLHAITGTVVNLTNIDGKQFELTVPPGAQPNTKFRISQQGLYQMNSHVRGDLYVELAITVPRDLMDWQMDLVKQINTSL